MFHENATKWLCAIINILLLIIIIFIGTIPEDTLSLKVRKAIKKTLKTLFSVPNYNSHIYSNWVHCLFTFRVLFIFSLSIFVTDIQECTEISYWFRNVQHPVKECEAKHERLLIKIQLDFRQFLFFSVFFLCSFPRLNKNYMFILWANNEQTKKRLQNT